MMRGSKSWGIKPNENIIIYDEGKARGAFLGKKSTGFKEIINFLNYEL